MLESYDWTKEALPTYPTTIGISNLSQMMADTLAEAEAPAASTSATATSARSVHFEKVWIFLKNMLDKACFCAYNSTR